MVDVVFDPEDFSEDLHVVSALIRVGDEYLLLLRCEDEAYSGYWGPPAGKVDAGEDHEQAVLREVFEETGISLEKVDLVHDFNVRFPEYDIVYTVFEAFLDSRPDIIIDSSEHADYRWVRFEDALNLDLVPGEKEALQAYIDLDR